MLKMIVTSWIMVPILCWSASDFAPMLTELAVSTGSADILVEGQQLAWWGMDIAEIRWMIVEVLRGNFAGFGVLAAFIALAVFYFKSQKKEEQEAAVRMGWVAEEK